MSRVKQIKEQRKQRIKYGDPRLRMSVDPGTKERLEKQGLVPRWVNDDGNVEKLQMRGYDFVTDENIAVGEDGQGNTDLGSRVSKIVGTTKDGKPMRAYLMVQDREAYEEDQELKEAENKQVDDAIRRGTPNGPQETSVNTQGGRTYVKKIDYQP